MKLTTIKLGSVEVAGIITHDGILPLPSINSQLKDPFPIDFLNLIESGQIEKLKYWFRFNEEKFISRLMDDIISFDLVEFAPLYRTPRKIWGIGLNYVDHANDLSEKVPTGEPASFMKPDTTIIGYKDIIKIPVQSEKTTGESELGIIIGKKCKNINKDDWLKVVAGFTPIIDMTAEDILRKNPKDSGS